jgi:hypothetical protein
MYAFILLLTILFVVYATTNSSEGFKSLHNLQMPTTSAGTSVIPVATNNKEEMDRSFNPDMVKPYSMPGELPVAGYEQIGASSPLPYQDTTLIKANRQQLVSLLEMVKGFLAFEAQEISEKSDPSVQLPLQTARSDLQVLQREVDVQNRNPGVQSTITLTNLNEMGSNLAYLQQQVRLTGAAGSLQGPINEFLEGFQSSIRPTKGSISKINSQIATVNDLTDFVAKIQGEVIRLSASGTNDPVSKARVNALTNMKASVQDIVDKVKKDILKPTEISIMKSDIDKALPILGKPSEPLPQIIKAFNLPPGLANVLPSTLQKDPQTAQQVNTLMDKYADKIINGVSASFQVKYTSPNEAQLGRNSGEPLNSFITKTGFPSMSDLNNVSNAKFTPYDSGAPVTDPLALRPMDAGRPKEPAHFDWKQRTKEIENQVKQRGLHPADFGITSIQHPSKDFSWKGYARMICTRLQATMDPALPETCGCPPMDWKGWR